MRKFLGLIICFLCLSGCSFENRELDRVLAFRQKLLQSGGCSFQTGITADYGDSLQQFELDCRSDGEGNVSFTVAAPESISGITGNVSETGGVLTFDGTALHFPLLADGQLSPVSAGWVLVRALRGGRIHAVCMEQELLHLTVDDSYEEDALMLDVWLDSQDRPVRGEILCDGRRILSLTLQNFALL